MAMETKDYLLIGAAIVGGWWLYRKVGAVGSALNPLSDKNIAYQAADKITKAVGGEKAVITDIIPGVNNYDPNKAVPIPANAIKPGSIAPYWWDASGFKRTAPMGKLGIVYDAIGRRMQIVDAATQAAVRI